MKFIKKFDTHQDYTQYADISETKIPVPLVSYCDRFNEVHYDNNAEYQRYDILYEKSDGSEQIISTSILEPELGYFPIGICVAGTDALGSYEAARFIGLMYVSYSHLNTYDTTNTSNHAAYGFNNVEIPDLPLYATLAEAQQDFNGEYNTKILLEKSRTLSDLDLDIVTSISSSSTTYSSAAICAYRYKTLTTNIGDWYFPALGECVPIKTYKNNINTILAQLNTKYPNKSLAELYYNSQVYLSSTRANLTNAWRYDLGTESTIYNTIDVTNDRRMLVMLKLKKYIKRI